MTCLLCGSATDALRSFTRSVTSDSKLLPIASVLRLCAECGQLQTTVEMDLARYYTECYDATLTDEGHDEIVSTTDGRTVFRTDLDFELMKRHLGDALAGSPSIMEFGSGRGRILSRLHKEGHRRLVSYDVSELYRDVVSQFVDPESIFIGHRPDGVYDVIISLFVLEHDVDPVGSLLYMRDRITPNGKLLLIVPNYVTNPVDLGCADHVNHFSPDTLTALMEACGLRMNLLDDTSAIGAMVTVATPRQVAVSREEVHLGSPERVEFGQASSTEFLSYMSRLEALTQRLRGARVALYGAGFYATLVQAHLEVAGLRPVDVFDANPRKQGTSRLGLTVSDPAMLSTGNWADVNLVMCLNPTIAYRVGQQFAPYVREVVIV